MNVVPFDQYPPISVTPQPLETIILLSVSTNSVFLNSTHKWSHTVFYSGFSHLTYSDGSFKFKFKTKKKGSAIYGNWEIRKRDDELGFYTCGIKNISGLFRCYAIHSLKLKWPSKPFRVKCPKSVSFFSKIFIWRHQVLVIALRIFYL